LFNRAPSAEELKQAGTAESIRDLQQAILSCAEIQDLIAAKQNSPDASLPRIFRPELDLPATEIEHFTDTDTLIRLCEQISQDWTLLGMTKPHWSVLSADDFLPEHMAQHAPSFYATGRADLGSLLQTLDRYGRTPGQFPSLVEFGCGVGRVTLHLSRYFDHVTAVDISASHLAHCSQYLQRNGATNATPALSRPPDYGMAQPFDLWFSYLVLQHNPPPIMSAVLQRALTLLNAGGLAIFQVLTYGKGYRFKAADYLARPRVPGGIELHCLPQHAIHQIIQETGCSLLELREDTGMNSTDWLSNRFVVQKNPD